MDQNTNDQNNKNTSNICSHNIADSNKLHVLVLHGYRQNGKMFCERTAAFRKLVHKWAKFTYITAPHKVVVVEDLNDVDKVSKEAENESEQFGWFFNRDNKTNRGIRKGGPAIGYEESINVVEKAFEEYGPFDGIMGFSQGACFVGLLCDLQQRGLTNIKFSFAIMISGFISNCLPHMKYYGDPINLPSLHVFGEADDIIPTEMSVKLRSVFDVSPVTVVHPGGHCVPADAAQKHAYQKFFKMMYLQKQRKDDDSDSY